MAKLCKYCNKFPVFGGGMCRNHQYLRTDKKPKKLSAIRKFSKRQMVDEWGFDNESDMFEWIWQTREHKCFLSGGGLDQYEGTDFFPNLFAHVLPKAQNAFPMFRLNPDNIVLLRPDIHMAADHGTQAIRNDMGEYYGFSWQKLQDVADKLMAEYKELDKSSVKRIKYV